ncbi:P-loop containing nucleoside triphosphate hydrolase protein [Penicillium angulare]|uniref:P-loop containing nucleoside triphosphate hydrolase protein n=1 Tax=Penicillium angulare TaxID=116970 RepID=A0A9W9KIA1_9EURO|nr:P-loop containing nucleoside triphosphate hydrolase protein [Penicillium angulare]
MDPKSLFRENNAALLDFRNGRPARPNDVFIAVMGLTGAGKSSFISLCSGENAEIGHDSHSCTSVVDVYGYEESPDRTVYLIDTPGFDDGQRNDTQILREIATWLGTSYENKILLSGILYLHRISDNRMQGSAKKNLGMFMKLCGSDAFKKVVLVETMWDKTDPEEAARREKELQETEEFWGWMISKGSRCYRHMNTAESARDIVRQLSGSSSYVVTDIQKQLIDDKLNLDETSAGRELMSEILKEREKFAQERDEMETQRQEAIQQHDFETEKGMCEERDRYSKIIEKMEKDESSLRSDIATLQASQRNEREMELERKLQEQGKVPRWIQRIFMALRS